MTCVDFPVYCLIDGDTFQKTDLKMIRSLSLLLTVLLSALPLAGSQTDAVHPRRPIALAATDRKSVV